MINKRLTTIKKYFKEQPCKLGDYYVFCYNPEEDIAIFCAYVGIVDSEDETFELSLALVKCVYEDKDLESFAE